VDVCSQRFLTSYGLHSLAPGEAGYQGQYAGGVQERDAAYHQGTVWGWLLGLLLRRTFAFTGIRGLAALRYLEPLGRQIYSAGLGTLSEIFEGDAPFRPEAPLHRHGLSRKFCGVATALGKINGQTWAVPKNSTRTFALNGRHQKKLIRVPSAPLLVCG